MLKGASYPGMKPKPMNRATALRSTFATPLLAARLFATRKLTLDLAAPLSDADATIQPFPDASPAKWHLAHTTWFFETFVLARPRHRLPPLRRPLRLPVQQLLRSRRARATQRPRRGMLSRPSLDEVRDYRAHVDEALERALPSHSPRPRSSSSSSASITSSSTRSCSSPTFWRPSRPTPSSRPIALLLQLLGQRD